MFLCQIFLSQCVSDTFIGTSGITCIQIKGNTSKLATTKYHLLYRISRSAFFNIGFSKIIDRCTVCKTV